MAQKVGRGEICSPVLPPLHHSSSMVLCDTHFDSEVNSYLYCKSEGDLRYHYKVLKLMYSSPFFVVAHLGVAPPSFGFISAGVELYVLTTTGDVMSVKSVMIVVVCALLSLLPVIFKRQLRAKIE